MFFGTDGAAAATDELPSAPEKIHEDAKEKESITEAARITHLYNAWSTLLNTNRDEVMESSDGVFQSSDMPRPPHLEDCRTNAERNKVFDSYGDNGTFPPWTLWKGSLGLEFQSHKYSEHANQHRQYPPWVCMRTFLNL